MDHEPSTSNWRWRWLVPCLTLFKPILFTFYGSYVWSTYHYFQWILWLNATRTSEHISINPVGWMVKRIDGWMDRCLSCVDQQYEQIQKCQQLTTINLTDELEVNKCEGEIQCKEWYMNDVIQLYALSSSNRQRRCHVLAPCC